MLGETDTPAAHFTSRRDEQRRDIRAGQETQEKFKEAESDRSFFGEKNNSQEPAKEDGAQVGIRTMSQLFAWAINNTVRSVAFSYSTELPKNPVSSEGNTAPQTVHVDDTDRTKERETEQVLRKKALPAGEEHQRGGKTRRKRVADDMGLSREDFDLLSSATASEFDIIKRNVRTLDNEEDENPNQKVSALLMLEELCHSIDNGRDLQISGGIKSVLNVLHSRHENVRASAAWALATCCQNNPSVQNASLALGSVPTLSRLAAYDQSSTVRAKALFALNAMLELEEARTTFEELPYAIDVLRNALADSSDYRAIRRALNLAELLVQRNLDAWKTQLEAYDIPVIIELLMRSHPDIDVRESAARTIAALDGRHFA